MYTNIINCQCEYQWWFYKGDYCIYPITYLKFCLGMGIRELKESDDFILAPQIDEIRMLEDYITEQFPKNGRRLIESAETLEHCDRFKKLLGIIFSRRFEGDKTEADFNRYRDRYSKIATVNWCREHGIGYDDISGYPQTSQSWRFSPPKSTEEAMLGSIGYVGTDKRIYAQSFQGTLRPLTGFDYKSIEPLLLETRNADPYSTDFSMFE